MRHEPLGRFIPIALIATTGLIGGSYSASAEPTSPTFPAGQACSFALDVSGSGGNSHTIDAHGNQTRTITAGTGPSLTFTNVTTGKTLTLPSNGAAGQLVTNPDGTKTGSNTGHNVLILFPGDRGSGLVPDGPSTTLIVGRDVYGVDVNGFWTVRSVSGKTTDLCKALS